ncbi:MAG: 3-hydroxyacyl-CoA dehydrogenase NAD-binding domain-containing protein, partial [Candidatus Thermoplasmatota archaeon]|nr:3-hydroxyacyl-CoA dehydrogenase NAD-binding domain-containing protein [Candidatus Thermoplasmatota archaeon]
MLPRARRAPPAPVPGRARGLRARGVSTAYCRPSARGGMEIRTVAVVGAGTMGVGIAQVCAQTGW